MFYNNNFVKNHLQFYFYISLLALTFAILFQTSSVQAVTLPAHKEITERIKALNEQGQASIKVSRLDRSYKLMTNSILVQAQKYSVIAADSFELGNGKRSITYWRHTITMLNKFNSLVRDAESVGDVTAEFASISRQEAEAIKTRLKSLSSTEPAVTTLTVAPPVPVPAASVAQIPEAPKPAPSEPLAVVSEAVQAPAPVIQEQTIVTQPASAFSLASVEADESQAPASAVEEPSVVQPVAAPVEPDVSQTPANLQQSVKFYVSPAGNDSNPGTVGEPFKTLAKARSAVAAAKASGLPAQGIAVVLRQGVYPLTQTFSLGGADSGAPGKPIVYQSYPGEKAVITGARNLNPSRFVPVTSNSPVWGRLDNAAKSKVLQINLASEGVSNFGSFANRSAFSNVPGALHLYFDGKPMTLARWPDKPNENSPANQSASASGFATINKALSGTSFTYTGDRPNRWGAARDVRVHGFFKVDYADFHSPLTNLNTGSKTMTVVKNAFGIGNNQSFYAYNLVEEITQPGEWYLDRDTSILYFWPPSGVSNKSVYVSLLETPLVELKGASWITLKDVVLEGGRAELVKMTGGSNNVVQGSTLRNTGGVGIYINASNSGIENSEVAYTGNGAVIVDGGNRPKLQLANNFVRNNNIHHFGQWVYGFKMGVEVLGIGHKIAHNDIYQGPHAGILWKGNEHLIEFNDIHDVVRMASDMGAMYSGRDWGWRGNVIQYNFIHDIATFNKEHEFGAHGIYMDDLISGTKIVGNTFYRIPKGYSVLNGGGRDNIIENNVFAKVNVAMFTDNRGTGSVNFRPGDSWNLIERISKDGINYKAQPWASKYPELAAIPSQFNTQDASVSWLHPEGSVFSRNIIFENNPNIQKGYISADLTKTKSNSPVNAFKEQANNMTGQNPLFVNEGALDLTLQPNSPAFSIPGFKAIPFNQIGIQ